MLNLSIDRPTLRIALAHLKSGHMARCGALPVLYGIRVTALPMGSVTLTTSDLEVTTVFTTAPGVAPVRERGTVVLPWADLKAAAAGKGQVTIVETGPDEVQITSDVTTTVRVLPVDEYPALRDASSISHGTVSVLPFADVLTASSGDDARPILTGIFVDGPAHRVVATDSYRLHLYSRPADENPFTALIPSRAVAAMVDAAKRGKVDTMDVWTDDRQVTAVVRGCHGYATTTSRLIEGEFPNYAGLLPREAPVKVKVASTDELCRQIRTAGKAYSLNTPVRLEVTPAGMVGRLTEQDRGETVVALPGWSVVEGEMPVPASFNPHYLSDLLAGASAGAVFTLRDSQKPAMLEDGARRRLLMPVRVS